ncbi:hypothetical protein SAMN05421874_12115 [Nonomuraea maritima]|uniref:Secreted protein n=1 Tax=Nonomuraea maritima TaxID=683260 RepID=A0A1G9JW16_9ACTN|nr:hypothetical protein [Nonomuraea maritima]SDL41043.1 hypothetical protein SAMN05421874_12115 [Nonomuraea maritima]
MTTSRILTGLALATAAALAFAPAAQAATVTATATSDATSDAATTTWGPHYAPGKAAKTFGTLTATGEDHADLPTADTVRITGKLYDQTRRSSCGWAVFRITYRVGNNLPHRLHSVRDCTYRDAKLYRFSYRDVYQVELKVCSEGKAPRPSLVCQYAGTWKTLYLSK